MSAAILGPLYVSIFSLLQLFTDYGRLAMESSDVKPFQVLQGDLDNNCVLIRCIVRFAFVVPTQVLQEGGVKGVIWFDT